MSPLGLRGFSQLSCRESGLRAVKTSGPGALGVLRVNGEPSGLKVTRQDEMDTHGSSKRTSEELGGYLYLAWGRAGSWGPQQTRW